MLELIKKLTDKMADDFTKEYPNNLAIEFYVTTGKKYHKVIFKDAGSRSGGSVHCFVDIVTGDIYKASSHSIPAKGIRFNIYKDIELLLKIARYSGGYLYK